MTRDEDKETASIHDDPLRWYPNVIRTLIRQRTLKIAKQQLAAKGIKLWDVTSAQLQLLAEAYFFAHREECIRVACDVVRIADGLRELAEAEARRRAKAALRAKDVTPARHLITYSKG
jgi:hypothetical protein